jgi:NAD(P)-dependent dehydrogenase (short-subunit alcohol dehydrogenase family)
MLSTNATVEGRVALVTGAVGGIGRAVCTALVDSGMRVVGADLPAAVKAVADSDCHTLLGGDITVDSDRMVEEAVVACGRLDAVVNLVGMNIFADLLDLTDADWDRVMSINLTGAYRLSRAAAGHLTGAGHGGSIVHFTSVTSLFGSPGQAAYAAAKAGLANLVKSMSVEWAPYGIRVNAVSPVMTRTPINADWLDEDQERAGRIAAKIPLGRLGSPTDYAGLVRFLVSDEASFVTGQTVFADGGTSLVHPLLGVRGTA